jgi:hypothetical protein
MITSTFRASPPTGIAHDLLGPLTNLPGNWMGRGFNLVSLPRNPNPQVDNSPFRLKVSPTMETLSFEMVGAPIPNRGSTEDIEFLGLIYLQKVANATTGEGMSAQDRNVTRRAK